MSDREKVRAEVEHRSGSVEEFHVLVYRGRYGNGWGIGVEFPTREGAQRVADVIMEEANRCLA